MNNPFFLLCLVVVASPLISQKENRYTGCLVEEINTPAEIFPTTRGDLPNKHSLYYLAPKAEYQDTLGSCVSWASAYTAMTIVKRIENSDFTYPALSAIATHSAHKLYYDSLHWDYIRKNKDTNALYNKSRNCSGGASVIDILNRLKNYGTSKRAEDEPSYQCFSSPSHQTKYPDKIFDFSVVKNDVDDIKKALTLNSPLIMVIDYYKKRCWADDEHFENYVWDGINEGKSTSCHAMVIVGYDDSKGDGAFHVINSWGSSFGDKGSFWIKYKDVKKINYLYRIILDPSRNNEFNQLRYTNSILNNPDALDFTHPIHFSDKIVDEEIGITQNENGNIIILDSKNHSLFEIPELNSNETTIGNYFVCKEDKSRNELIVLKSSDFIGQYINHMSDSTNQPSERSNEYEFKYTLKLENIGKIKSIWISEHISVKRKPNSKKIDFQPMIISIITEENKTFIWKPKDNSVEQIFTHKRFDGNASTYFNPFLSVFLTKTKDGKLAQYDLIEKQLLISESNVNFTNYDMTIQPNIPFRFSQPEYTHFFKKDNSVYSLTLQNPKKNILFSKTRIVPISKINFLRDVTYEKLIQSNNSKYLLYLANGKLTKSLNLTKTSIIQTSNSNPIKNAVLSWNNELYYQIENTIFVEKINFTNEEKGTLLKEYKNIHSLIDLSPYGAIIARDIDGNLLYLK